LGVHETWKEIANRETGKNIAKQYRTIVEVLNHPEYAEDGNVNASSKKIYVVAETGGTIAMQKRESNGSLGSSKMYKN
jgi:L-asparaginase/Glu-tRNA(Gln) amidotransferase subunit D